MATGQLTVMVVAGTMGSGNTLTYEFDVDGKRALELM